jgi:hypothetical protein
VTDQTNPKPGNPKIADLAAAGRDQDPAAPAGSDDLAEGGIKVTRAGEGSGGDAIGLSHSPAVG